VLIKNTLKMGSKIYEDRKPRYRVILLETHKVKRLYLLKGMPYCQKSFIVSKIIHYDLVSGFSTGPCVLHTYTLLQNGRHRFNTIFKEVKRKSFKSIWNLLFHFIKFSFVLMGGNCLCPSRQK